MFGGGGCMSWFCGGTGPGNNDWRHHIYFPTGGNGGGSGSGNSCPGGVAGPNKLPTTGGCSECMPAGSFCIAADQVIGLADGSQKLAGELTPSDQLIGQTKAGELRVQSISNIQKSEEVMVHIVLARGEIRCSESHPIYLENGNTMMAKCIDPGDRLFSNDSEPAEVQSVKKLEPATVVSWQCSPDENFFVDGILHHNKTKVADPM